MFSFFCSESAFDSSGRPLEPAFFTGFPAYHNLIHQIYEMREKLEGQEEPKGRGGHGAAEEEQEDSGSKGGEFGSEAAPKFWVKKKTMANILAEEITDEQVCHWLWVVIPCSLAVSSSPPLSTMTWCLVCPS